LSEWDQKKEIYIHKEEVIKMKSIWLFLLIGFLLIGTVSAWELNPFADTKYYETSKDAVTSDFLKETFNADYGVIQFSKTFLWVETDRIAEYSLIESKDSVIDAYAYGKATLYSDGKLFDSATFKDAKGSEKELRDAQYFISINESYEEENNTYIEVCEKELAKNGTQICKWEVEKYQNATLYKVYWKPYNFEILKAGNYEWKAEAKKDNANQKIDFIPYAQGKEMSEWVWWNSSWAKKQAINVYTTQITWNNYTILLPITYDSDMQADFDDLRFTNGAENVELNYWLNNKTDSTSAYVWVNVSLTSSANTTIYMYYANAGASSSSNRANVFTTINDHGATNDAFGENVQGRYGMKITTTQGVIISSITKSSTATGNMSYIENSGGSVLTQKVFSGNTATYDNPYKLATGTDYFFGFDKQGGTFASSEASPSQTYPATKIGWNWVAGRNWNGDTQTLSGWWFCIKSVGMSLDASPTLYFGSETSSDSSPIVSQNSPANAVTSTTPLVTFNCTASDGTALTNVSLYVNETRDQTNTSGFNNSYYLFPKTFANNGFYNWSCGACDSVGQCTNTSSRNITLNVASPTVTLNTPINSYNSTASAVSFNCSVSDAVGVQNVSLFVNGTLNQTNTSGMNNTPYYFSVPFGEGFWSWSCNAKNTYAYSTTATYRNLSVDTIAPTITLPVYANATKKKNTDSLTLNVSVIDTGSGLTGSACKISINGGANQTFAVSGGWCNTTTVSLTSLTDGNKTISVYANDSFNNLNLNSAYVVWIDTTPPVVTLPFYANATKKKNTDTLTLNISVADAGVGGSSCYVAINGGANQTFAVSGGWCNTTTLALTGATDGNKTISVYANDTLNNLALNNSYAVWIDTTAPIVTLNSPINAYNSTSQSIIFNCTASDNAQLQNVSFYLNNSLNETNTSGFNNSYYLFSKTLADGFYNWTCGACDSVGQCTNATARNTTINSIPTINVSSPVFNNTNYTTQTIFINATNSLAVDLWKFNINGTNYTLSNINTSVVIRDGFYQLLLYGRNSLSGLYGLNNSVYLTVNTTPFIAFVTPPTLVDHANITQEYIPMKVTVTTGYFKNITYYLENVNSTSYTLFFTNTTYDINFTDMPDAHYHYNVTICTTTDKCNTTETRHINHDVTPPIVNPAQNLTDVFVSSLPTNSIWNYTATDEHISTCYYNITDLALTIVVCNSSITTAWATEGNKQITYCANDTFGSATCRTDSIRVKNYPYAHSSDKTSVGEGDAVTFTLRVNGTDINTEFSLTDATLSFNGVLYSPDTITKTAQNYSLFEKILTIPSGSGNLTGAFRQFNWTYSIKNSTSTVLTQTTDTKILKVVNVSITDCGVTTGRIILNMSLKDEGTKALVNATAPNVATIEVNLIISSLTNSSQTWEFYKKWDNENTVAVCVPNELLNDTSYKIDILSGFDNTGHVREFWYLENGTLDSTTKFNPYTENIVDLMDLLSTDSTTFLFEFTNIDGLEVPDAIIHTFRKYIGSGQSLEVERSKQDNNGETHVHLVEEDVIYYFMITQYGNIIYTSDEYNAKCLSTPCAITLTASPTETNWSIIDNEGGDYAVTTDKATRVVSVSFDLGSSDLVNFSLYKFTNGSVVLVNTSSLTASAGSIDLSVPLAYGNSTFFVSIFRNNTFVKSEWVSLKESAKDYFGGFGAILGGLLVLAIMLMAVSEGAGFIIFTCFALVIIVIMQLVDLSWMAIGSIICAGGIIVWKLMKRRNKQG
jgi:hypothetical protein